MEHVEIVVLNLHSIKVPKLQHFNPKTRGQRRTNANSYKFFVEPKVRILGVLSMIELGGDSTWKMQREPVLSKLGMSL
jgi:hypothetical protein